jgi:hypothetical protein
MEVVGAAGERVEVVGAAGGRVPVVGATGGTDACLDREGMDCGKVVSSTKQLGDAAISRQDPEQLPPSKHMEPSSSLKS